MIKATQKEVCRARFYSFMANLIARTPKTLTFANKAGNLKSKQGGNEYKNKMSKNTSPNV
jgi:hypothetical protein